MTDEFFPVWTAQVAEAYCVLNGIPCKRKFTDAELAKALQSVREQREALDYADAMIEHDRRMRHEGRPDHDMTIFGTPLKPGK